MDLLTVNEVASRLRMSSRTIWRMQEAAKLPSPVRLGRVVRWRRSDIEQWIDFGCPSRLEFDNIKRVNEKEVRNA